MPMNSMRRALWLAGVAGSMLAIAGCGSSSSTTTSSSTPSTGGASAGADPTVAALVPAADKAKGTLTVAADASYAPNEFVAPDGKTVEGMDVDLGNALAGAMGLKFKFVNATFATIIPGLSSGKFDVGMSSFTDTKEREKTVDFVTYFSAGTSFYTKAQGGTNISGGLSGICGIKVAVEQGTTEQTDAAAQDKKCKSAGKPGVTVLVFPDQNGANLALSSGRAQVVMVDTPVADYGVKQGAGKFKITGATYGTAPYGIALPKGSGLAKPLLAAVKAVMANGMYTTILTHWGIQAGAITNPTINGATS
jgi:polar amino acid transport system substrate-binding protein